jgi:hypothetical protein
VPLLHTAHEPSQPSVCELELEFFWMSVEATKALDPEKQLPWADVVHDSVLLVCMGGEL